MSSSKKSHPRVYNKHHKDAPPGAVYIGRGSIWGNPYEIGKDGTREQVIERYGALIGPETKKVIKELLKGKDLVCYCAPKPCHGDILLRIANEEDNEENKKNE